MVLVQALMQLFGLGTRLLKRLKTVPEARR
jgi:hypothetical protein